MSLVGTLSAYGEGCLKIGPRSKSMQKQATSPRGKLLNITQQMGNIFRILKCLPVRINKHGNYQISTTATQKRI